jgi:hypothetical protein
MEDFVKKEYYATVASSDVAFVWVNVNAYYDPWKINKKDRTGAVLGVKDTAGRKNTQFQEYNTTTSDSRQPPNVLLWVEKLIELARSMMITIDEDHYDADDETAEEDKTNDDDTTKEASYVTRLSNILGDSSDDDCEEDDDVEDEND